MSQSTAYSIRIENNQITLQFNANLIDLNALTRFLDRIELESIRKNIQFSEEAAMLAYKVNQAAW